jgi:hypothetical protein
VSAGCSRLILPPFGGGGSDGPMLVEGDTMMPCGGARPEPSGFSATIGQRTPVAGVTIDGGLHRAVRGFLTTEVQDLARKPVSLLFRVRRAF